MTKPCTGVRPSLLAGLLLVSWITSQAAEWNWETSSPEEQGLSTARLEQLWSSLERHHSQQFLVIRNDKVVFERYTAGLSRTKPHYTASMAKAVVGGVSVACALSDGSLTLDEPSAKYVVQWQEDAIKRRITLRHLGSHSSGIEDAEEDKLPHDKLGGWKGDFWQRPPRPNDPFTLARDKAPVLFEPGTKFHYSNPGMAMLGYVVTAAEKKDLRTLLRERVMQPLSVAAGEWTVGYGQVVAVDGLPLVATWGGGSYSPDAVARVGRLMLHKGKWEGKELLRPSAVEAVTRDAGTPRNCGIGWWSNNDGSADPLPRDSFWGSGAGHQVVLVIPSMDLIAVRFGDALKSGVGYDEALLKRFFEPLMAAVGSGKTSAGSSYSPKNPPAIPLQAVPRLQVRLQVDGRLTERFYRVYPPLTSFVVAGQPGASAPTTKAWLFWRPDGLAFAFDVVDAQIVAAPPSKREHDVDNQDRVEIFLWSGRTNDTYYCIEVAARGALHDYSARFYRQFDDNWRPKGIRTAATSTPAGYSVEGLIPRAALEQAGFRLSVGQRIRCGLFRADFAPDKPDDPAWICWVDAHGPKPDFHVAGSFGEIVLEDSK